MANRYWVGSGTGSWGFGGTSARWSATSGGAGGETEPTSADDVFFDVNSGSTTCYINPGAVCKSLTMTGSSNEITGNVLTAYGNVTIGTGVTCSGLRIDFASSATLTCNGKTIDYLTAKSGATVIGSGAVRCTVLTVENTGAIVLPASTTSYCTSFVSPGSGSSTLQSSSAGVQATLSDSSGVNTLTYITVQDMILTGGATWTQSSGFVDGGNNTFPSSSTAVDALFALSLA